MKRLFKIAPVLAGLGLLAIIAWAAPAADRSMPQRPKPCHHSCPPPPPPTGD